jgi:hypothetical protein
VIYESKHDDAEVDDIAREAVASRCDKFRYKNAIYQIDFTYRCVETVSMTDQEAKRQFGDK